MEAITELQHVQVWFRSFLMQIQLNQQKITNKLALDLNFLTESVRRMLQLISYKDPTRYQKE